MREISICEDLLAAIIKAGFAVDEDGDELRPFNSEDEELEVFVQDFLIKQKDIIQVGVHSGELFDSPGFSCGYVTAAFIVQVDGCPRLGHVTYEWELR